MFPEHVLDNDDFVRALTKSLLFEGADDDARQQAWVAALRHPPADPAALPSFLRRCIERLRIDTARANRTRTARERASARGEVVPSTAEIAAREEARRRVVAALLALDDAYRDVLVLRFYESLPPRSIAARLALPVETVRTRIKRGLDRLRRILESDFGNDPRRCALALAPLARVSLPLVVVSGVAAVKFLVPAAAAAIAAVIWLFVAKDEVPHAGSNSNGVEGALGAPPVTSEHSSESTAEITARRETVPSANPYRADLVTVSARVVDLDFNPIENAAVVISRGDSANEPKGGPFDRPPERTDRDGIAEFRAVPANARFELYASAPGHSPALVRDALAFHTTTIVLDHAQKLLGQVIDIDGNAVAGAIIEWKAQDGEYVQWHRVNSGADGRFAIDELPTRESRRTGGDEALGVLLVAADGFAPVTLEVKPLDRDGDVDVVVVVDRGARLEGEVVAAETGEPIAGATIVFESRLGEPLIRKPFEPLRVAPWTDAVFQTATSDARGRFTFPAITAESFHEVPATTWTKEGPLLGTVIASLEGRASGQAPVQLPSPGSTTSVRLELALAGEVRGRVVDSKGHPQPDVFVSAQTSFGGLHTWHYDEHTRSAEIARTDAEGRYVLNAVPCGADKTARRIFAARAFAYSQAETSVTVRPGERVDALDLVLDPEPTIELEVVDHDGKPIPLACAADVDRATVTRVADANGRIRYFVDPETAKVAIEEIRVEATGFVAKTIGPLAAADDPQAITRVVLDRAASQRGRVRFRDGSPAAFARVVAVASGAPAEVAFMDPSERDTFAKTTPLPKPVLFEEVVCDSRGRFELRALPESTLHVVARATGTDATTGESLRVTAQIEDLVPSVNALDLVLPALPPRAGNRTLEGTATDMESGVALTDFSLELERDGRVFEAERIAPGRFRFRSLEPGEYLLDGRAKGHRGLETRTIDIPADRPPEPLRIEFDRGVTVHGRLSAADGDPLVGAIVTFRSERGERCEMARVADGRYMVAGLVPGTWRAEILFSLRHQGQLAYTAARDRALVVRATDRDLNYDIEAIVGGSIFFEFEDERLPPILAAKKTATPEQRAFAQRCELVIEDERGEVYTRATRLENGGSAWIDFPAGEYLVRFRAGDDAPIEKRVTVTAGSFESITLP